MWTDWVVAVDGVAVEILVAVEVPVGAEDQVGAGNVHLLADPVVDRATYHRKRAAILVSNTEL